MNDAVLVLHVLAAIAAFGPSFAAPFVYASARRLDPAGRLALLRVQNRIDTYMVLPAMLVLAGAGAYLIAAENLDVGVEAWLAISINLYALILVLVAVVALPAERRMLRAAEAEAGGSPLPEAGKTTSYAVRVVGWLISGLVVAILYLMVAQPG